MGLKWFRARMSLDKPSVPNTTGVPGFYRTISNFDGDVWPPPPTRVQRPTSPLHTTEVNSQRPRPISKPVPPPQVPNFPTVQNPMATMSAEENSVGPKKDSGDSEEVGQFKLPRASVDILREKNSDNVRKAGIKKKKGVAPIPDQLISHRKSSTKELVI